MGSHCKFVMNQLIMNKSFASLSLPFLICVAWFSAPLIAGADAPTTRLDLLITGGHVFDTQAGEFKRNPGIGIVDGKFVDVPSELLGVAIGEQIELAADDFVLPGIVDCHAHYNVRLLRKRREEFKVIPITYLANGVTTTFSCGEFDPEGMEQLRKQIQRGEKAGPNLINSGPYFGRARPGWRGEKPAEEIREEVDFWARRGVGGFKAKAIGPEELRVLIERAHHHGLTVTGHLDSGYRGSVNPRDAIAMGIDRIEHFLGGDAMPDNRSAYASLPNITADMPEFKRIVATYLESETVFDATLSAYGYFGSREKFYDYWVEEREFFTPWIQQRVKQNERRVMTQFQQIFEAKQKTIRHFFEAGGKITLGTDHFSSGEFLPGFGAHREMEIMVASGIPEAEVLRIATINGARALGIEEERGSLEPGKIADLMVVRGNPLEDIRNTRSVHTVLSEGRRYDSQQLLESVKGQLGPADESETGDW